MRIEQLSVQSSFDQIEQAAQLEADVLLDEVKQGNLPTIDIHLPRFAERIARLRETGLLQHVTGTRLDKIVDEFDDPYKTTFIATDEDRIIGIGRVRIRPELDTAVLYGFNIDKTHRGSQAGLSLLEQCVNLISEYAEKHSKNMKVRINRYSMTEKKKPAISLMTRRLNKAYGQNTVTVENDDWDGQPFMKFTTDFQTFAALVDRYGDTLPELL